MRALFSLAGLLLVVFIVMKLTATQLKTVAGTASPSAAASAAPANAAQAAADQVNRALSQGAATRAAQAASQ
jgi:hypothetical protein